LGLLIRLVYLVYLVYFVCSVHSVYSAGHDGACSLQSTADSPGKDA